MPYKVAFVSLGCAKNLVNTEQMMALCRRAGYDVTGETEGADVAVLNTCGFIESAKSEAINSILELAELKKAGKLKKLLVAGCLTQRYREEIRTELPEVDESEAVRISQKALRSMIDESIFAVSTNESRPVYMGSLFELEGGRLTMVSVDGYRLAIRRESVQGGAEGLRFIIPGSALLDVERLCADSDEEVLLNVGTKHSSFTIGGTVVVSRKLEGDFLNYKKSLPENFRYVVKLLREDMLGATDRVSLVVDEKMKSPVRLIFGDGRIDFFCNTPLGRAGDVCPCEGEGGDTEIGFNDRYLRDALRAAPVKELEVCINTGSSPCVIRAADGGDEFTYMILPVRLKAGE